ncbi:hypothetical protein ABIB17_000485 [Arthrobacter sp. UYEF6]
MQMQESLLLNMGLCCQLKRALSQLGMNTGINSGSFNSGSLNERQGLFYGDVENHFGFHTDNNVAQLFPRHLQATPSEAEIDFDGAINELVAQPILVAANNPLKRGDGGSLVLVQGKQLARGPPDVAYAHNEVLLTATIPSKLDPPTVDDGGADVCVSRLLM